MKKTIVTFTLVLFAFALQAQNFPYGINYQAVARDANGNAKTNTNVNLRFTIAPSTSTTSVVYQETQNQPTNNLGQFNAIIGTGTSVQTFSNVVWQGNSYSLIVEINPGTGYQLIGVQKLQAVPYAFESAKSDTAAIAMGYVPKYAVYQEVYAPGNSPATMVSNTWYDIALSTAAVTSNSSDINISGVNITLNAGIYKITGWTMCDFYNNGQNAAFSFVSRLYNSTSSTQVFQGSTDFWSLNQNDPGQYAFKSQIETILVVPSNGTVYKFQRLQYTSSGNGLFGGNSSALSMNRILGQLMIEKIK